MEISITVQMGLEATLPFLNHLHNLFVSKEMQRHLMYPSDLVTNHFYLLGQYFMVQLTF